MNSTPNSNTPVWDPAVRLFHWSLAAAFLVAHMTEDHWEILQLGQGANSPEPALGRRSSDLCRGRWSRGSRWTPPRPWQHVVGDLTFLGDHRILPEVLDDLQGLEPRLRCRAGRH